MLTLDAVHRMFIALTDERYAGPQVVDAINQGQALAQQSSFSIPAAIVASSASSTANFAALKVGDLIVHIPASAGNAQFAAVVTAGTLPFGAAVVGDLYIDLRAYSLPPSVATNAYLL